MASEWISVGDRLPEYVAAKDSWGASALDVLLVVWGTVRQGTAYSYKSGECVFTVPSVSGDTSENVTHWMPLPEPPPADKVTRTLEGK